MRLCLIAPIVLTSEAGTLRVNGNYGRLIGELAEQFESIDVVAAQAWPSDRSFYPLGKSLYTYPLPGGNVHATLIAVSTPSMSPFQKAWAWLRRIAPLYRALGRADLVYLAMPGFSSFMAFVICRLLLRPYFLYYASEWQSLTPFFARWGRGTSWILAIYQRLAGWAEAVPIRHALFTLAAGSYLQERLRGHGSQVLAANPMVSLQRGEFSEREDTCQSLPITVLYVGSLIRLKGVHVLVRALAELEKRGLEVRLVLVGPAHEDYQDFLHEEARRFDVESKVSFEGYVTEWDRLLDLYRAADVFALATESEGFPRVLYEAMSQGLPVVATSIPPIAQSLTAGQEALLVPPGSAEAMADGIEKVVRDPALRRSLIAHGRAFAQSKVGSRTTAQQILELLREHYPPWKLSGRLEDWAREYYSKSNAYEARLASKWSEGWQGPFSKYIEPMTAHSPAAGTVLDLGCGGAQTTFLLASSGLKATGADVFFRALRSVPADKQIASLSLVNCDAGQLPFADAGYDVVGAYAMLEHATNAVRVLDEMHRVLRPGGWLIVAGPNMLSPFHALRLWLRAVRSGKPHPDGTLREVASRLLWSIRRAISSSVGFPYRDPHVKGLEFPGSDYDAVCMVNPFDLLRWARSCKMEVERFAEASSREGRLVQSLLPHLAGGICLVARKARDSGR